MAYNVFLSHSRQVYCRFEEIDEVVWVYKGLPQGSVLSLLLYALYVKDLETTIPIRCRMIQYTDDIVIFASSNSNPESLGLVECAIESVTSSLNELGLDFSIEKTKLCFQKREDDYSEQTSLY